MPETTGTTPRRKIARNAIPLDKFTTNVNSQSITTPNATTNPPKADLDTPKS
jgi:hypothetical protein